MVMVAVAILALTSLGEPCALVPLEWPFLLTDLIVKVLVTFVPLSRLYLE